MTRFRLFFVLPLLLSTVAGASSSHTPFPVTVLSVESDSFQGPPLVPRNCDFWTYDAYCHNSSPETYVENVMTVREPDGKSLQIECTAFDPSSHCAALPVNQTFQAMPVKRGLEIRYKDQHHKVRKEVYEIVSGANGSSTK
jgi:hypothetical protein